LPEGLLNPLKGGDINAKGRTCTMYALSINSGHRLDEYRKEFKRIRGEMKKLYKMGGNEDLPCELAERVLND
jgi:hypothetical protein